MEVEQPPVKNISMTIKIYVFTTVMSYTFLYNGNKFQSAEISILKIS